MFSLGILWKCVTFRVMSVSLYCSVVAAMITSEKLTLSPSKARVASISAASLAISYV